MWLVVRLLLKLNCTSFSELPIDCLSDVIMKHLRDGDRVRLDNFGLMKLEIVSDKVDAFDDFKPKKHIQGVRLHFIPESIDSKQPLYDGIKFEKVM
jgi:hypothetical protein